MSEQLAYFDSELAAVQRVVREGQAIRPKKERARKLSEVAKQAIRRAFERNPDEVQELVAAMAAGETLRQHKRRLERA